jgi:hypothetical protein
VDGRADWLDLYAGLEKPRNSLDQCVLLDEDGRGEALATMHDAVPDGS